MTRFLPALYGAGVALLVALLTVNVPMFDEWTWAPLVLAAHAHRLTAGDLWAQQQAHRSVVPTLFMLGLAQVDGWDVRIEALFNIIIAFATLVSLAWLFARIEPQRRYVAYAMAGLFLFSLLQAENWFWGFQMSWFLVNFFVFRVVGWLTTRSNTRFILGALAAAAASLSLIFGFGAWIAGMVMLAGRRRALILWCAIALATSVCFLLGYHAPRFENGWARNASPLEVVQFILVYLGGPAGAWGGRIAAEIAGVALIAAFAIWSREAQRRGIDARAWYALAAFVLTAACMEAFGRAGNGVDAATPLRYVTTSTLAWIALIGLSAEVASLRWWRVQTVALALALAAGSVVGYFYAYQLTGLQRDARIAVQNIDRVDDEELSEYTADPQATRALAQQLRAAHLGPYR